MKKLLLLLTFFSVWGICSAQTFGTISTFTQVQSVNGSIQTTVPLDIQYGIDYIIASNLDNLKVFAAGGAGHTFNGSNTIINNVDLIGGLAIQPVKNVPLDIGAGAGAEVIHGKFIAGINTDYSLTPLVTMAERAISGKRKVKGNLKISF